MRKHLLFWSYKDTHFIFGQQEFFGRHSTQNKYLDGILQTVLLLIKNLKFLHSLFMHTCIFRALLVLSLIVLIHRKVYQHTSQY